MLLSLIPSTSMLRAMQFSEYISQQLLKAKCLILIATSLSCSWSVGDYWSVGGIDCITFMIIVPIGPYFLVMGNSYIELRNNFLFFDRFFCNNFVNKSPIILILEVLQQLAQFRVIRLQFSNFSAFDHLPLNLKELLI